ncbi:MAG TPA: hypothetical protein VK386_02510 [Acidimicrobiales bacterium]|nr:hypothetical protein [Acidimicrobiales bacterium]
MSVAATAGQGFSSTARHQVEHILARPPYTASNGPRPLAGIFHALGRGLDDAFGPVFRWLYHHLVLHIGHGFKWAFGDWWPLVAGALALAVGALAATLVVRRRSRIEARHQRGGSLSSGEEPGALEVEATAADAAGDFERAVRLRFRAGVLRLVRQGSVVDERARTDRQLTVLVSSRTFEQLARSHERIVYGREPAVAEDSSTARQQWPRALAEARSAGGAG